MRRHLVDTFSYSTPGLEAGTHVVYTPTPGDQLVDAWIEPLDDWDGTTPTPDIGMFMIGKVGIGGAGFGAPLIGSGDLTDIAQGELYGTGFVGDAGARTQRISSNILQPAAIRFGTADPLCLVVSQDGTPGGGDPGSTMGRSELHLVIDQAE